MPRDRLYYLTEEQFLQINRVLPPEDRRRGRPPTSSNRDTLEGILPIRRTGTPWRDLPPAYGAWHTIYMRWRRWVQCGVWWPVLMILTRLKGVDLHLVFLDSTVVRAHQHAAGAPNNKGDQALGRVRGGLSTTIHALCASESDAIDLRITAGQAGDAPVGEEMSEARETHKGIAQAAMDKAYDSNAIRAKLAAKGIAPVIPPKANRLDIILYDKEQYKQRNKVERLFNKIKQFRRVATRYEKLKVTFFSFVILALIVIMLR